MSVTSPAVPTSATTVPQSPLPSATGTLSGHAVTIIKFTAEEIAALKALLDHAVDAAGTGLEEAEARNKSLRDELIILELRKNKPIRIPKDRMGQVGRAISALIVTVIMLRTLIPVFLFGIGCGIIGAYYTLIAPHLINRKIGSLRQQLGLKDGEVPETERTQLYRLMQCRDSLVSNNKFIPFLKQKTRDNPLQNDATAVARIVALYKEYEPTLKPVGK